MLTKTKGLTGNQLKILAMLCMTVDHVGYLILPQYIILRCIGRLAMPIFAFMIAEGCRHTKNRLRYLLTVVAVAAVCQVVYWVADQSLLQCILVTFSLSIILIYALDFAVRKQSLFSMCLLGAAFAAVCYICLLLPRELPGFRVDYGFFGVMLPVAVYVGKNPSEKLLLAAGCMVGIALQLEGVQWFAFAALPILYLYNGERGKLRLKYLFYLYYPLHLAAIYGIAMLIN